MTTEHVSVPREELERLYAGLGNGSIGPKRAMFELSSILSRATPIDKVDAAVLKHDEREEQFAHFYHQHCGRGGLVLESVAYALDKIKPSAPRVVSDEDVERACEAFEGPYHWEFQTEAVKANSRVSMRAALESLPAVNVLDGWKDMPCYVIHPSNVDDEKKPLHKIDFGMELDGKLIFTSKYVPNGETPDAVAYIRDWTPDCVREYVVALKQAIQDASLALDEAEKGLLFASTARQPTKLGRDRSRERLHFVQGIHEKIKSLLGAAPNPNDAKEEG